MLKRYLLTTAITAALAACGGGGSSGGGGGGGGGGASAGGENSGGNGGGNSGGAAVTVNGTASAPAGAVALLKQHNLFEIALNALISPAAAAVIGLDPVNGATVELIRIDNAGNQVGDVLATATTSISGEYSLQLPTNVNLSGDLVVRIRGANAEMRAQVVDQTVNISPVSEFVLRKFIALGTNLSSLSPDAVVILSGKVDQFDLTATSDLTSLLQKLDAEVGGFVENQIGAIAGGESDASSLDGDYRNVAMQFGLHDSDGQGFGTFGTDLWTANFTVDGHSDGSVTFTHLGEEAAFGYLHGADMASTSVSYSFNVDTDSETLSATLGKDNVLTVEGVFEEDINEEVGVGWRYPPGTYRFHKVHDRDVFFLLSQEAAVRYRLTESGAVDPQQRDGDEVFRGLEMLFKKPTDLTNADLNGAFGRVYLGASFDASASIAIESEANVLVFEGSSATVNIGAAEQMRISRTTTGTTAYDTENIPGEPGLVFSVNADGDIESIGDENVDGYVNDLADLVVFGDADGYDGTQARASITWMVKLPTSAPAVAGKTYRLMFLDARLVGKAIELSHSRGNSTITFSSNSAGSAAIESGNIFKDSLQGEVEASRNEQVTLDAAIAVGANGHTTVELDDADGTFYLEGYLNATGSYGVFRTGYAQSSGEPIALGLAVLIETPQAE